MTSPQDTGMDHQNAWDEFEKLTLKDLNVKDEPVQGACSSCKEPTFSTDINEGYRVCKNCGLVGDINVDPTAEWRCFTSANGTKDSSAVRCGPSANPFFPEAQLSTVIGGASRQRLQRVHHWNSVSARERNISQTAKEFDQIAGIGLLGQRVVHTAVELYVGVYNVIEQHKTGSKRCSHRQGLKAACVYFSCKQIGCPRERKELAEIFALPIKVITKGINLFMDIMGEDFIKLSPLSARDFIPRYCATLELPFGYQARAVAVLEALEQNGHIVDLTPPGMAAGALFFVSELYGGGVTKKALRDKCKTSAVVVGKGYMIINEYRQAIVDHIASKNLPQLPDAKKD